MGPGKEAVVLVDEEDRQVGEMEKLRAHLEGRLHRAVSVFVLDSRGRLLLQRRAAGKYHSAGLWANSCCGHPRPGERPEAAAARRLKEEMGLSCELRPLFVFRYAADVGGGMRENEVDHVFLGFSDAPPTPDPAEVMEWRYETPSAVSARLRDQGGEFAVWFKLCWPEFLAHKPAA